MSSPSPAAPAPVGCAHCGRALSDHAHAAGAVYCCSGCEAARAVVNALGLQRFDVLGGAPGPVQVPAEDRTFVDGLHERVRQHTGPAPLCLDVDVEGVTCASCAWLVEKASSKQEGVRRAVLNPALGRLTLEVEPQHFAPDALVSTLRALGHRVGPPQRKEDVVADELFVRFGVSAALASAAMIFAFSFYFGLSEDDAVLGRLFSWGGLVAATIAVAVGGVPFFRGAKAALVARAPTMDIPIALGMLGALGSSALSMASGGHGLYFDTVSVFVTLMLLGRLLERRVVEGNRRLLLAHDGDVAGLSVRRLVAGERVEGVAAGALRVGDVLLLPPGELCPVDGKAQSARWLSLAWIDGEAEPREIGAGQPVPAGAHNVDTRPLHVEVTAPFDSSRLARLLAPAPERAADALFARLSRVWVWGVLLIAGAGLLLWLPTSTSRALEVVTAVLVVTCPCAFGIAAPIAIERATALLRARGVFVKSPTFLARARRVRTVIFDKTGTLTSGELALDNPAALRALHDDERRALATLTTATNHPKGRAIARYLESERLLPALHVEERVGQGVVGGGGGHGYALTRAGVVENGDEALVFTVDGQERARFLFREALREGAADEVARLRAHGIEVRIASGDAQDRVDVIARRLGIPASHAQGDLRPEDKRDLVARLDRGDTMFIGDGVNDALAFAAAACAGTPAVDRPHLPARADFFLLGGDLGSLVDTIVTARRLRKTLVTLLSVATVYNAATVTLSLLGLMSPVLVAIVMPISSLSLISGAVLAVRAPKTPGAVPSRPHWTAVPA